MMKRKNICVIGLLLGLIWLSGCGQILEMPVGVPKKSEQEMSVQNRVGEYEITANDRDTVGKEVWEIDLNSLKAGQGENYHYDGRQLIIDTEGTYAIRGKMKHGNIVICAYEDEIVHLILDDVELTSDEGPAIYAEKAAKVIITAKEGTENILSDGLKNGKEQKACVFSNCDLTFNGSGRLSVYGYHADAIRSKDRLKIVNSSIYVKAKESGIRGNDGVILINSETEVECEGIGVLANSEKDMVIVQGGSLKVIAGKNAISSTKYVSITESQVDLYSILETIQCEGIREFDEEIIK